MQCNKLIFISKWKIMCRVRLITIFFFCIFIELISKWMQWFHGSVDLPHLQCTHRVINVIYEQYYTNASRCTLAGFLLLMVYCLRKSGVDSHLVIFCHSTWYLVLYSLPWTSWPISPLKGLSEWRRENVERGTWSIFHATSLQLKHAHSGEFLLCKQNSFAVHLLKMAEYCWSGWEKPPCACFSWIAVDSTPVWS